MRDAIVVCVRALIAATERLQHEPKYAQALVAQTAQLDLKTVASAWPCVSFPGTLAPDLLDVLFSADASRRESVPM